MRLGNLASVAILLALSAAGSVSAATITADVSFPNPGTAIPDNSSSGISFDINIGTGGTVSDVTVRFNMTHPQVGDIHVTLTNPQGDVADVVYRLGGDTWNRNYGADYSFNDANTTGTYLGNFWTAAAAASGTNAVVDGGAYFASTTTGTPVSLNTLLGGDDAAGIWTLTIYDLRNNNTGNLHSWGLTLETGASAPPPPPTVPEPSAYILFGLGLGALATLRRRR
jgi:subtilisin-like proprotein convertase family protein